MEPLSTPRFAFSVEGTGTDAFQVVRFTGRTGLSRLYEFDILLASPDPALDTGALLTRRAVLTMSRPGRQDMYWNGMVQCLEQLEQGHGLTFYRAVLCPRAWWLTQFSTTQIFLDEQMRGLLETVLTQAGLARGLDFELRLKVEYPRRDWICQYDETHWNFFNRLLERAGLYFFFEQDPGREKLVVTDTAMAHVALPGEGELDYRPASGLGYPVEAEAARTFRQVERALPREVLVRDYNWRTLKQVEGVGAVSPSGLGVRYRHVEDLRSDAEADYVARARADGMACLGRVCQGESTAPFLRPGYNFTLRGHYRPDFNRAYTTVEVNHEARQEAFVTSQGIPLGQDRPVYRNTFLAIPSDVQFRPEPVTPRPVVGGPVTAWIDGEEDGQYAEVDAMGRYKVRFPVDLSGRGDGKASHWIRMLTPYAGSGHGLHLPLHKGTEVLVVFRDGNPDKPVIAGAVPNQAQKMAVTRDTRTQARLTTAGGNLLHFEDRAGGQGVVLSSPTRDSWVRVGSSALLVQPGKDEGGGSALDEDGLNLCSAGWFTLKAQESTEMILGNKNDVVVGVLTDHVLGGRVEGTFLGKLEWGWPWVKCLTPEASRMEATVNRLSDSVNNFIGERLNVVEQEVLTAENRIHAVQEQTAVNAQRLETMESSMATCVTRIDTVENRTANCVNHNQLVQAANYIFSEMNELGDSVTQISQNATQMRQEVTSMEENATRLRNNVSYLYMTLNIV